MITGVVYIMNELTMCGQISLLITGWKYIQLNKRTKSSQFHGELIANSKQTLFSV